MTGTLTDPALGMSFSFQIDEKRQVVFQTHVERDISSEGLDVLLDKLCTSIDRQIKKYLIETLETQKEEMEKQLRQMAEDLAYVDERNKQMYEKSGKRGEFHLTAQQLTERSNALKTQNRYEDEIRIRNEKIERLRNAASGAANSNHSVPIR